MFIILFLFSLGGWLFIQNFLILLIGHGATTVTILFCIFLTLLYFNSKLRYRLKINQYSVFLLLSCFYLLIHLLVHFDKIVDFSKYYALPLVLILCFFIANSRCKYSLNDIKKYGNFYILFSIIMFFYEIYLSYYNVSLGSISTSNRVPLIGSTATSINYISVYVFILAIFIFIILEKKIFFFIFLIIIIIIIAYTRSRGNFLTITLVSMLIILQHKRKTNYFKYKKILILFLIISLLTIILYLFFYNRIIDTYYTDIDNTSGRLQILKTIFHKFTNDPFWGSGIGVFFGRFDSHCILFETLFEMGILGFLCFSYIFLIPFHHDIRGSNVKIMRFYYYTYITLLLQNMTSGSIMFNYNLFFTYSLLISYYQSIKNEKYRNIYTA